jgi:alanyl-tRNA synthetase
LFGPTTLPLIPRQILQSVVSQGKKLGKAVYVFSPDRSGTKVAHVNYIPPSMKAKGADARTWATRVSEVLGGKVSPQRDDLFDFTLKNKM